MRDRTLDRAIMRPKGGVVMAHARIRPPIPYWGRFSDQFLRLIHSAAKAKGRSDDALDHERGAHERHARAALPPAR